MYIDLVRSVAVVATFDETQGRGRDSLFCNVLTPADARALDTFEHTHLPFFKVHEGLGGGRQGAVLKGGRKAFGDVKRI